MSDVEAARTLVQMHSFRPVVDVGHGGSVRENGPGDGGDVEGDGEGDGEGEGEEEGDREEEREKDEEEEEGNHAPRGERGPVCDGRYALEVPSIMESKY